MRRVPSGTVLVVDDDRLLLRSVDRALQRHGYRTIAVEDPELALQLLDLTPLDAVITDLDLPLRSGETFVERAAAPGRPVPVLVMTGHGDLTDVWDMLNGALPRAVIPKPFAAKSLIDALDGVISTPLSRGADDVRELALGIARTLDLRDLESESHTRRVALYARRLAIAAGLGEEEVFWCEVGGLLHDVGKVAIPDAILRRREPLGADEMAVMRKHPQLGDELLAPLTRLAEARPLVRHHHERWDGTGYPSGLAGEEIPFAARIFAVVDAFDSMTHDRGDGAVLGYDEALARLRAAAGTCFDPTLVELFAAVPEDDWKSVSALAIGASEPTVERPSSGV